MNCYYCKKEVTRRDNYDFASMVGNCFESFGYIRTDYNIRFHYECFILVLERLIKKFDKQREKG